MANATDERILKLWTAGLTIPRIAARIGRPGDFARVRSALRRNDQASARAEAMEVDLQEPATTVGLKSDSALEQMKLLVSNWEKKVNDEDGG